jgi:hypothetical protein
MRIYVATIDRGEFFEVVKRCAASSRQAAENRMGCGPADPSHSAVDVMTARQAIKIGAYDPKGYLGAKTIFN